MNKFRQVRGQQMQPVEKHIEPITDLTLGALLERSARGVPPGMSPDLGNVRFEEGALRKDFGSTAIGTAAGATILGIGEHKFILNGQSYHRLIRLYIEGGVLALDIWDGSSWTRVDTFPDGVFKTYLDLASTQDRFLIADGSKILTWYETATTGTEEEDFPAGNSLTAEGESTTLVLSDIANDDEYHVRYYVDITITDGSDYDVELEFHINGTMYSTKVYELASGSNTWLDELMTLLGTDIQVGDLVEIVVTEISAETPPVYGESWLSGGGSGFNLTATKSIAENPDNGLYTYRYNVIITADPVEVRFYYRESSADSWTLRDTQTYNASATDVERSFSLGDLPINAEFKIESTDTGAGAGGVQAPSTGDGVKYNAIVPGTDITLDVHGYNQTTDLDPFPGVTYAITIPPSSTLELLSADAPGARFILPFGDRLLAYRDGGDVQAAAWSSDGDITDWVPPASGGTGDAGATVLLDTRSDGIDALMGAAVLTSSVAALFRQRSIMRVQETGNVALAVGHYHWVEGLGTESPFSIQSTPYGILFLGHDLQVYLLTEGGPQPIGQPIHQWLVENLTSNADRVDSVYDPIFGEYYLGVPVGNSDTITKVWILDVGHMIESQNVKWRMRELTVDRFGMASVIE